MKNKNLGFSEEKGSHRTYRHYVKKTYTPDFFAEETFGDLRKLENIPVDQIQFYVNNYSKAINKLKSDGVRDMADLIRYSPKKPMQVTSKIILEWKETVIEKKDIIVAEWEAFHVTALLPESYNEKLSFDESLRNAITEYAELLKRRAHNVMFKDIATKSAILKAEILNYAYRDRLSDKEITQYLPQSHEHFRKIRTDSIGQLLLGKVLPYNAQLHPELCEKVRILQRECLFRNISTLKELSGSEALSFIPELGFDVTQFSDISYIVPKGKKKLYDNVCAVIMDTLTKILHPQKLEELQDRIDEDIQIRGIDTFDQAIIRNILADTEVVDFLDDSTIQVKAKHLTSDRQRYSRIIYSAKEKISTDEVICRYIDIYHRKPAAGPAANEEYGIYCQSKRLWYYGEPRPQIEKAIEAFALKRKTFSFSELITYLTENKYSILKSIRAPITKYCSVDNKDANHFCHKAFTQDFPEYSWRSTSIYGQSNWALQEVRKLLLEHGKMKTETMIAELVARSKGTQYERIMKKRAKTILNKFTGPEQPLREADGTIFPNEPYFSKADFKTLGLRLISSKNWGK